MERIENNEIREIAKKIYTGHDFETTLRVNPKNFERTTFIKKVITELKKNLKEKYADRVFDDKNAVQKVRSVMGGTSRRDFIELQYSIKSNKRPRNDPIIDFDSDVSSVGDSMDQSALDTSLLDSMNDSQVSTRSISCRVEQLEAKIHALEAQNKALDARALTAEEQCRLWQEKSKGMFKVQYRPTRANGSGRCEVFDSRLEAIVLDAENRGVAAKHVHHVCRAFVDVLGWFDEDTPDYRIVFIIY